MSKALANLQQGPSLSDEYVSRSIRFPLIRSELDNLLGQVLTIIDASITSREQNKALKDLIRQRFADKMHGIFWEYCYRKEYKYDFDNFLGSNIVDGMAKHSEMVYETAQGSTLPPQE